MQGNRDVLALNNSSFYELNQIRVVGVSAGSLGYLQNDRGFLLLAGLGDALDDFHVVDVERADGVAAVIGLLEHFGCGY